MSLLIIVCISYISAPICSHDFITFVTDLRPVSTLTVFISTLNSKAFVRFADFRMGLSP